MTGCVTSCVEAGRDLRSRPAVGEPADAGRSVKRSSRSRIAAAVAIGAALAAAGCAATEDQTSDAFLGGASLDEIDPGDGSAADRARLDAEVVGIELPPGPGRDIVARACTECHTLRGIDIYRDFYDEQRWLDLVRTMVENGAEIEETDIDVVAHYLVSNFGTLYDGGAP